VVIIANASFNPIMPPRSVKCTKCRKT